MKRILININKLIVIINLIILIINLNFYNTTNILLKDIDKNNINNNINEKSINNDISNYKPTKIKNKINNNNNNDNNIYYNNLLLSNREIKKVFYSCFGSLNFDEACVICRYTVQKIYKVLDLSLTCPDVIKTDLLSQRSRNWKPDPSVLNKWVMLYASQQNNLMKSELNKKLLNDNNEYQKAKKKSSKYFNNKIAQHFKNKKFDKVDTNNNFYTNQITLNNKDSLTNKIKEFKLNNKNKNKKTAYNNSFLNNQKVNKEEFIKLDKNNVNELIKQIKDLKNNYKITNINDNNDSKSNNSFDNLYTKVINFNKNNLNKNTNEVNQINFLEKKALNANKENNILINNKANIENNSAYLNGLTNTNSINLDFNSYNKNYDVNNALDNFDVTKQLLSSLNLDKGKKITYLGTSYGNSNIFNYNNPYQNLNSTSNSNLDINKNIIDNSFEYRNNENKTSNSINNLKVKEIDFFNNNKNSTEYKLNKTLNTINTTELKSHNNSNNKNTTNFKINANLSNINNYDNNNNSTINNKVFNNMQYNNIEYKKNFKNDNNNILVKDYLTYNTTINKPEFLNTKNINEEIINKKERMYSRLNSIIINPPINKGSNIKYNSFIEEIIDTYNTKPIIVDENSLTKNTYINEEDDESNKTNIHDLNYKKLQYNKLKNKNKEYNLETHRRGRRRSRFPDPQWDCAEGNIIKLLKFICEEEVSLSYQKYCRPIFEQINTLVESFLYHDDNIEICQNLHMCPVTVEI